MFNKDTKYYCIKKEGKWVISEEDGIHFWFEEDMLKYDPLDKNGQVVEEDVVMEAICNKIEELIEKEIMDLLLSTKIKDIKAN